MRTVFPAPRDAGPLLLAAFLALAVLAPSPDARADRRIFGFTYPYMTLPRGGFEIEHYLDAGLARPDDPATLPVEDALRPSWQHQVEFEYGITDHWDFGFYNVFRQKAYEAFDYRGPKLRTRHRFGEEGDFFVDPAVYLEVAYFGDEIEIEERLILAKTWKKLEVAFNLKVEQEIEFEANETEVEHVLNPTLGAGWHFTEHFAAGLEYFARIVRAEGEWGPYADFIGPTMSFSGTHYWWTVTAQKQLSSAPGESSWQVRSLFAVVF
ncbi:MAG: hypothetical protein HY897_09610 [Deltaproteobacteria bacterium]|nr:hypothetical protein [Deltaproteobacteria bacterium]